MKVGMRWISGVLLAALAGCGAAGETFDGEFVYLNKSGVALTDVSTTGFELGFAGPGNFPVGGHAEESFHKIPYPDNCTISWKEKATPQKQTLPLKTIPSDQRKGKLVFEFTPQKTWTFHFSPDGK